jgi:CysZ protein
MVFALARAFANLFTPALRRIVGLSIAFAVASYVVLWVAVAIVLDHSARFAWRPLDWFVEFMGTLAVMALSWLMFPAVVTLVMGFFLERIAAAVEALDYPGRGPARRAPVAETALVTVRLMALTILVNLLALPVYLLMPGINFFVFLGLNGYLFGREYFEVVALRRLDRTATGAARQRYAGRVYLGGVVIAGLFIVPLVDLVAPVIATAFMVHLFEDLRRLEPHLAAS